MRAAVVQLVVGADKSANLARLRELISAAADAGAGLVVCPEASMHTFGTGAESLADIAEPLTGRFVTELTELAQTTRVTVVAGMFESVADDRARAYNTVVAVGPTGLLGRYRKLHLFDALGWVESKRLSPGQIDGTELLTFPCGELTVGVLTCYDVRFPELPRRLVDAGAQLLAVPSAWVAGPLKEDQWLTLVRARAVENTCYVVGAGQCGPQYAGHSLVADPAGVAIAGLAEAEGVALAEVSAERVAAVRARMPSLEHRRFRVVPA